jgi:hypothetical protein
VALSARPRARTRRPRGAVDAVKIRHGDTEARRRDTEGNRFLSESALRASVVNFRARTPAKCGATTRARPWAARCGSPPPSAGRRWSRSDR